MEALSRFSKYQGGREIPAENVSGLGERIASGFPERGGFFLQATQSSAHDSSEKFSFA
jgi:hypothetical protein